MAGAHRFLKRLWDLAARPEYDAPELDTWSKRRAFLEAFDWARLDGERRTARSELHAILDQANRDVQRYQFNTVVAAGMKIANLLQPLSDSPSSDGDRALLLEGVDALVRLLAPVVPHITHAVWDRVKVVAAEAVIDAPWPRPDPEAMTRETVELAVQVNGRVRSRIHVPPEADKAAVEAAALADDNVQRFVAGKDIRKIIVVPGRLVNVVV